MGTVRSPEAHFAISSEHVVPNDRCRYNGDPSPLTQSLANVFVLARA